jgi:hypothetical protein
MSVAVHECMTYRAGLPWWSATWYPELPRAVPRLTAAAPGLSPLHGHISGSGQLLLYESRWHVEINITCASFNECWGSGSGMERNPDPESGMNIPDHFSESLGLKIPRFFYAYPRSGIFLIRDQDGKIRIQDKYPGSSLYRRYYLCSLIKGSCATS